MFLSGIGPDQSGLDRLIQECYSPLGPISHSPPASRRVRAWTITKGTKSPRRRVKSTSTLKGFIRAEVVAFDDLVACGSMTAAKEKDWSAPKGKNTSCRTAMWSFSGLTCKL